MSDRAPLFVDEKKIRVALIAFYVGSVFALEAYALSVFPAPPFVVVGALVIAAVFAGRYGIMRLPGTAGIDTTTEYIPYFLACILTPAAAPLIAMVGNLTARDHPSISSRINNAGSFGVAAGVTVVTLAFVDVGNTTLMVFTTIAVFAVAHAATLSLFVLALRFESWKTMSRIVPLMVLTTTIVLTPLIALVLLAVDAWGTAALPTVLIPLAIAQYFYSLFIERTQLTADLAAKNHVLAKTNLQFAAAMVRALDARDAYTAGHSAAVAVYTRDIAREMGFSDELVRVAHLAGLLHDIGKIGVPGRVLNKTAPLDDEEYELMKSHAAMGAEILGEVDLYSEVSVLVRHHHERIDGKGYPDRIGGDAIPAISRMISVADTYSAMTTDRPYRDGMPTAKAMSILEECRGTQLDADFAAAFLRILGRENEAYQRGKQTDFEVEVAKHQALSGVEAEAVRVSMPKPLAPAAEDDGPGADVIDFPNVAKVPIDDLDLEREAA